MRNTFRLLTLFVIGVGVIGGCASTGENHRMMATAQTADESGSSSSPAPETSNDEPVVNTLKWTTASEVDNFGFDIYRGLSEDGPFQRVTTEPLPGAGTTDEPQKYVFLDEDIDPEKAYFYYIESISLGGIREIFSPIIKAPAKRP